MMDNVTILKLNKIGIFPEEIHKMKCPRVNIDWDQISFKDLMVKVLIKNRFRGTQIQ